MNFKGAIFDMDGTILDSMKLWEEIDIEFLSKRGYGVPEDYMRSIAHMGAMDTALYTIKRFNLTDTPEALIDEWLTSALKKYKSVPEKEGVSEYFSYLYENGVKIAVATATERFVAENALEDREFYKLIDSIVTIADVKRGKGFPDIYLKAAENLGLNSGDCIVFEDILVGVRAAKEGVFLTYGIYDERSAADTEKIKAAADGFIYSFNEMFKD